MRKQFRDTILDIARSDNRVVIVLGDISVYFFNEFKEKYPERFFNMGICENTLISVSAGLKAQGFFPFVHTIAPFITERSYEQVKLDMCYNGFGGNIVTCGASFDYAWDGATHHCFTDLAILRLLPNIEVMQPGSRKEVDVLMKARYRAGNASYFRLSDYPHSIDMPVEFGKGVVLKDEGADVTVVTAGPILQNVISACDGLKVNLLYFHTIKPIDSELLEKYRNTRMLVVHDAYGLYEAVTSVPGLNATYYGLTDSFLCCYGTVNDIRKSLGLDRDSIREKLITFKDKKT